MNDALLLVDVVNDFRHENAKKVLASFRERHAALVAAVEDARAKQIPIVYANDNRAYGTATSADWSTRPSRTVSAATTWARSRHARATRSSSSLATRPSTTRRSS